MSITCHLVLTACSEASCLEPSQGVFGVGIGIPQVVHTDLTQEFFQSQLYGGPRKLRALAEI